MTAMLAALFEAETEFRPLVMHAIGQALADLPIHAAGLYGSVARGDDGPGSDLDILAVTSTTASAHEEVAAALRERLLAQPVLRPLRPSLVALPLEEARACAARDDPFWTSALAEAVPIPGVRSLFDLDDALGRQ